MKRDERSLFFRGDLPAASARSASKIATHLGPRVVSAADELTRALVDSQRRTVAVDHAHVGAVAIEARELVTALGKPRVIITGHTNIIFESRKTAHTA